MDFRRQRLLAIIALLAITFFVYIHSSGSEQPLTHYASTGTLLNLPDLPPANGTLGFGAIAAVSRATSERRDGLVLAANITEIDITIPLQPVWTDEDLANIRAENNSRITNGSALAWLGHHNVLRWFLDSNLETVLILEDDVDWDIHLRTSQIPKAAAAVRHLMAANAPDRAYAEKHYLDPIKSGGYWGPANITWDILYLGHCGDIFSPSKWNFRVPRAAFEDHTMPPRAELHRETRKFLDSLDIPEDTRMIHRSIFPLCTFGFALTRNAAYRLLHEIAPRETAGGTEAYDVRILEACRDEGLRCWSAQPELFHHMDAPSEIAIVNKAIKEQEKKEEEAKKKKEEEAKKKQEEDAKNGIGNEGEKPHENKPQAAGQESEHPQESKDKIKDKEAGIDVKKIVTDAQGRLQGPLTGRAPNIQCGARSKNFRTKNPKTLEYLREVVGRQGTCLRDVVEEDMSRNP